jgi:hypothetical protein
MLTATSDNACVNVTRGRLGLRAPRAVARIPVSQELIADQGESGYLQRTEFQLHISLETFDEIFRRLGLNVAPPLKHACL